MALPAGAQGTVVDHVDTHRAAPDGLGHDAPAWPVAAHLLEPTDRYTHDILGGIPPFAVLEVGARSCGACRHATESLWVRLPEDLVFEDIAPRLWDITGDGRPEVVVVESHVAKGARLAVWAYPQMASAGPLDRLAATDHIGTPQRWLAPVAAADFDGDGQIEIAYVDRPHLLGDLVFVRLDGARMTEVARMTGVTNHRIGDRTVSGGLRDCGTGPELVLASMGWDRLLTIRLAPGGPEARDAGRYTDAAMAKALDCR